MSDDFPASVDVEYTDGEGEQPEDYPSIHDKIEKAVEVTQRGLEEYDTPAVMWTGGEVPRGQAPRLPVSTTHFTDSTRESAGSAVSAGVDSATPRPTWWRRRSV